MRVTWVSSAAPVMKAKELTITSSPDSTLYGDPEVFRPERWLETPDLPIFSYGLGYRMCAGYTLANRVVYVLLSRIIASVEIAANPDVDADHLTGCHDPAHQAMAPKPVGFRFRPRDAQELKDICSVVI
jgi:3-hydroxyphenylacetate 6-hydroxylase